MSQTPSSQGKVCPKCGAEGKHYGEHETAARNYRMPWGKVVDVGWRCWSCGYEWGFEIATEEDRE